MVFKDAYGRPWGISYVTVPLQEMRGIDSRLESYVILKKYQTEAFSWVALAKCPAWPGPLHATCVVRHPWMQDAAMQQVVAAFVSNLPGRDA